MTIIGLTILDAFYKILASPPISARRCYLNDTEVEILTEVYNFEDCVFAQSANLVDKFGLSAERIRQIYRRGLKKIAKRGMSGSGNFPATIIRNVIDSMRNRNKKNVMEVIALIAQQDLDDFPAKIVIDFLSRLYFVTKEDRQEAREAYQLKLRSMRLAEVARMGQETMQNRKAEQFERVLKTVVWFDNVKTWKREAFERQVPKRKVNDNEQFIHGTFWSDKCKREVQYESGQELYLIKLLEISPKVEYYLEQPVIINYSRHGRERHYTPDFAILLDSGQCVLAEAKTLFEMTYAVTHRKMEALIEYCERHGFGFLLTNGKYSIDRLLAYQHNPDFESTLRERLYEPGAGTLYYSEYNEIFKRCKATYKDLLAIVIKNGWSYYPSVFRLNCRNPYLLFRKKIIEKLAQLNGHQLTI